MCRHLAYLGAARAARRPAGRSAARAGPAVLGAAPAAARHRERRRLRVGWYVDGHDEPARHRGAGPVWADETFADLARVIRARCVLAAVRSATPGMPAGAGAGRAVALGTVAVQPQRCPRRLAAGGCAAGSPARPGRS